MTLRAFAPAATPADDLRELTREALAFPAFAGVRQVHGGAVATVDGPGIVPHHDALVTGQADLLLTVVAADCALILLADAEAGVVGACHSGWRGTVAHIASATVEAMRALGSRPERTLAWIAPCISTEAFEVGEEVAAQFAPHAVQRRPEWPRPHVDLRAALLDQLRDAGLPADNVETDPGCPVLDTERFHSYRVEGPAAGRMVGYIGRRSAS
jgi:YfiH family protein